MMARCGHGRRIANAAVISGLRVHLVRSAIASGCAKHSPALVTKTDIQWTLTAIFAAERMHSAFTGLAQFKTPVIMVCGLLQTASILRGRGHHQSICRAAMLQAGNHTEQHLEMVDHSGDANEKGSDGTFIDEGTKQAGNSPVTPDSWISCSERMPEDGQEVIVHNKLGYRYVSYFDEHSGLFFDMRGGNQMNCIEHIFVTHWMPLPAAPQQEVK
ncbi:DUF551 domain-containing protein [Salmonella enterica]